jgi:hypothetical protein
MKYRTHITPTLQFSSTPAPDHSIAFRRRLTRTICERIGFVLKSSHPVDLFLVGVLMVAAAFLAGCASSNRRAAENADPRFVRQVENDHEIHGEVGALYGQTTGHH